MKKSKLMLGSALLALSLVFAGCETGANTDPTNQEEQKPDTGSNEVEVKNDDGSVTKTTKNEDGSIVQVTTYEDGTSITFETDAAGNTKLTDKDGTVIETTTVEGVVTTVTTYKDGKKETVKEELDGTITTTASDGTVTKVTADGVKEVTTKAEDGTVTTVKTDANDVVLSKTTEKDNIKTVETKDSNGNQVVSVTDAEGKQTVTVTDSEGAKTVTAPDGTVTATDKAGNVTVTSTDGTVTKTSTDGTKEVTKKNEDGSVVTTTTTADGTVATETVKADGTKEKETVNADGTKEVTKTDAQGNATTESFDKDGNATGTKKAFEITFVAGAGATEVKPVTVTEGEVLKLPAAPSKTGYTFDAWYTDAAFNTKYDEKTVVTGKFTLYAHFNVNKFKVTYVVNGKETSEEVEYNSSVKNVPDATKTGYDFYWKNKANEKVADLKSVKIQKEETFTAVYEAKSYKITFNANGGTKTTAEVTGKFDTDVTLTANGFEKENADFNGWNTKADGSGTNYADTAKVKMPVDGLVLYAQWKEYKTVKYNLNGASLAANETLADTKVYAENKKITKPAVTLTRKDMTFVGWYADDASTEFDFEKTDITENITINALWKMTDTVILPTSADGLEIANGNSQTLVLDVLPEDYVAKKGDKITLKIEAKTDIAITNLKAFLIDNAEDTKTAEKESYAWNVLTEDVLVKETVDAESDFEATVDFTVIADQIGTGKHAHKLAIKCENEDKKPKVYPKGFDLSTIKKGDEYTFTFNAPEAGIVIPVNDDNAQQCMLKYDQFLPATTTLKKNDVVHLTIKGKSDVELKGLQVFIVDNSETASWWKQLTEWTSLGDGTVAANTDFEYTIDLTITENQIGTGADAHKLGIAVEKGDKIPTLYPKGFDLPEPLPEINAITTPFFSEENYEVDWSNGRELPSTAFENATNNTIIVFECDKGTNTDYSQIKMQDVWDGDVTVLYNGTLINCVLDGEPKQSIKPNEMPGRFGYIPTAEEWIKIKANGIKLMGHGLKISKIGLQ